ncbi:hypothetical protein [Exiguobacterium chiriqhucha]|uniref:hypothetical protein n=1 Tax=Exiguobacterium chiriqhucha TaxID=1385984 RepID=UPI0023F0AEE9|nr:hypothetical protein [Exiguobacterium chiriqhucha]
MKIGFLPEMLLDDVRPLTLMLLKEDVIIAKKSIGVRDSISIRTSNDIVLIPTRFVSADSIRLLTIRVQRDRAIRSTLSNQWCYVEVTITRNDRNSLVGVPWGSRGVPVDDFGGLLWKLGGDHRTSSHSKDLSDSTEGFGSMKTRYAIDVGINFDFLNKIKANDIYYGVNYFSSEITDVLGGEGGFFQSRTITEASSSEVIFAEYAFLHADSASRITSRAQRNVKTSIDVSSFYLNTIIKNTAIGMLMLNFEYRRKNISIDTLYNIIESFDTIAVPRTGYSPFINSKATTHVINQDRNYLGLGLLNRYNDGTILLIYSFSFMVHPVGLPYFNKDFFEDISIVNKMSLTHLKSHVKLGGEIRFYSSAFRKRPSIEYQVFLAREWPLSIFEQIYSTIF